MRDAVAELRELTLPTRDLSTLRALHRIFSRVLVHEFLSLPAGRVDEPLRATHVEVATVVRELARRDARAVVRVLRHPTVQAVCGAARRHAAGGDLGRLRDALLELDLLVLFELAADGALPGRVEVARQASWPELRSVAANLHLRIFEDAERLAFANGAVEIASTSRVETLPLAPPVAPQATLFSTTRPYHELRPGLLFATTDNNPLADVQGHPERAGNRLDLGGKDVEAWTAALSEALLLIEAHLPLVAQELRQLTELVVPVGWNPERHFSCSFEEAVGAIYLTLHPNPMTLAEALVHEFQHNKLNAVLRFDALLVDARAAVHRSPLRPDPRPLKGVLMAVHAFEPVARLYENMTAAGHPFSLGRDWPRRFRDILRLNRDGLRTVLTNAHPTPLGRVLLDELRALDDYFARYEQLQWPALVGTA